jgi:hypothetical protein
MSETINPSPSPLAQHPAETFEQFVARLKKYDEQADASLAQVQSNIDTLTSQINDARRVQLMIAGQKQLLKDLISRTPTAPTAVTVPEVAK